MKISNDLLIPELARLLAEEKEVRFTPTGDSMRPYIEGGKDSVILSPLHREPKKGDILMAKVITDNGQNSYVLHRMIGIEINSDNAPLDKKYVLQGDGNLAGEEYCYRNDIIAIVRSIEYPSGKRKWLTKAYCWRHCKFFRKWLLKIYRHTWLKWAY